MNLSMTAVLVFSATTLLANFGYAQTRQFTEGVWIKKYPNNYACFKFQTAEGLIVVSDPFDMNEVVHPNIVTESHQHFDHTDVSKLTEPYKLFMKHESYAQKGLSITGYSGHHNKGDVTDTNDIYLFDMGGIKIAHFASQGDLPNDDVLGQMGQVDVLLIQASIRPAFLDSKLTLKECDHIIRILKPKIVIPEHGTEHISEAFSQYYGLTDEYASNGEIYVTRKMLNSIVGLKIMDLDTGAAAL